MTLVVTSISSLLLSGCPANIARSIVAIYVNAVDAVVCRWSSADIIKEGLEIIEPFIAHVDSSASVIAVVVSAGIKAAFLNLSPRTIFRCPPSRADARLTVLEAVVVSVTAATNCRSVEYLRRWHAQFYAAVAATEIPMVSVRINKRTAQDNQSTASSADRDCRQWLSRHGVVDFSGGWA